MVKEIVANSFKMCVAHPKQQTKFYCSDCQINTCNLCVDKHPKHELKGLKNVITEYLTPWKHLLNQVNRCIANMKPDISDKIKENIFKAQGKCNRMIKASTELDVKALFEAKDTVAKYTENSVKIYKLSVRDGAKIEKKKEKKAEMALLIASTVASEKQPENSTAKTDPAVLERIEELCS